MTERDHMGRPRIDLADGRYLVAYEEEHVGLTRVWAIHARRGGAMLGWIRWHAPWRQYVFAPQGDYGATVLFNRDCLLDVAGFLKSALDEQSDFRCRRSS